MTDDQYLIFQAGHVRITAGAKSVILHSGQLRIRCSFAELEQALVSSGGRTVELRGSKLGPWLSREETRCESAN